MKPLTETKKLSKFHFFLFKTNLNQQKEKSFQKQLPEVFYKETVLNKLFFTGKHLCWSVFLIKLQVQAQYLCFSVNIAKFLGTSFLENICEWLVLSFVKAICHAYSTSGLDLQIYCPNYFTNIFKNSTEVIGIPDIFTN